MDPSIDKKSEKKFFIETSICNSQDEEVYLDEEFTPWTTREKLISRFKFLYYTEKKVFKN